MADRDECLQSLSGTRTAAGGRSLAAVTSLQNRLSSVVIVSAVRVYRDALVTVLAAHPEIAIEGTVATADDALALVAAQRPAVVVLDAGMSGAITAAERIRHQAPATRLVAFGLSEEEAEILAWAAAGVTGYVMRDEGLEQLTAAIYDVLRGEVACAPRVASTLLRRLSDSARFDGANFARSVSGLTTREQQILALLDLGLSNKDIAQRLNIEVATVKNHVHHLLQKLHVSSRAEAAARFRAPVTK
jgi:two-component system nitrate/nitrite response regulator NarL